MCQADLELVLLGYVDSAEEYKVLISLRLMPMLPTCNADELGKSYYPGLQKPYSPVSRRLCHNCNYLIIPSSLLTSQSHSMDML